MRSSRPSANSFSKIITEAIMSPSQICTRWGPMALPLTFLSAGWFVWYHGVPVQGLKAYRLILFGCVPDGIGRHYRPCELIPRLPFFAIVIEPCAP